MDDPAIAELERSCSQRRQIEEVPALSVRPMTLQQHNIKITFC